MIIISNVPFHERLTEAYFQKCWRENEEYLEKHGKSPYEYEGRFVGRTRPWLDSGYWMSYDKWLKDEFNITHASALSEYHFETEEEAAWFILRWS